MRNNRFLTLAWKLLALCIAGGVGTYLVLCGPIHTGNTNHTEVLAFEDTPPSELDCEALKQQIEQSEFYMSTSKAMPSAAEISRVQELKDRYNRHCNANSKHPE